MLINLKVDGRLEFGFKGIGFIMIGFLLVK